MNEDVLIVSYDKGYGGEISILLVSRKTDKGMKIIKAFDRDKADKVYELLSKWNKSSMVELRYNMTRNEFIKMLKENLKPNAQMDFLLIDKINGKDFVGFLDIKDVCMNVDVDDPNNRNRGGVVFSVIKNLMEKDL